MADFNRKKLQVFVSSTFTDLIPERQAAVEAILTAGHIPAGMELFTAGDESQMEVIKQWIDESDVYLLILGGRYGSTEPSSGKSYTQLEYEYAISKGKPFFACVIKDPLSDARVKARGAMVIETENPQRLKGFRDQVLTKSVKFWEDSKDIKIAITETLSTLARRENLVGWVRSNTQSNLPALADEIARLSQENAQLRGQLASGTKEDTFDGLTFAELKALLETRGLLGYMISAVPSLARPTGTLDQTKQLHELYRIGVVGLTARGAYCLSQNGRAFINRLEAQQLAAPAPSKPGGNEPGRE